MSWLNIFFRPLNKGGDALIEQRREDGHGSAADKRSYVEQDSGENEYIPGLGSGLIPATAPAGYTKIYDQATAGNAGFKVSTTNTPGRAFYIRSVFAVSVERDTESAPVLSLEIRNADDVAVFHVPYTMAAIVKRKKIICPVNGKVYLKTDIACRLPWTIDIQEIP